MKVILAAAVLIGCYLVVLAIGKLSKKILRALPHGSMSKTRSLVSLGSSLMNFAIYFAAVGFMLNEFGISLTAYLASASIIGLAVGFGSQGLVQDVVTGLTLIFSDLVDVGDMVEISGQTGLVKETGVRFTKIVNHLKAEVNIPNRTISSVIRYPLGHVRCNLDIGLGQDSATWEEMIERAGTIVAGAREQFAGIFMQMPEVKGPQELSSGNHFLRIECCIWPGRGDVLEKYLKPEIVESLRQIEPEFADWMVAFNYESESVQVTPVQRSIS